MHNTNAPFLAPSTSPSPPVVVGGNRMAFSTAIVRERMDSASIDETRFLLGEALSVIDGLRSQIRQNAAHARGIASSTSSPWMDDGR